MSSTTLKSPYKSRTGKPWMRKSWVVYLDILGFSSEVSRATQEGSASQLLSTLISALDEAKVDLFIDEEEYTRDGIKEAPYAVKMFTDNVVLGFPIREDGEGDFGRMIYIVGLWQFALLKHGFFVRGGVTVGPLYMDDDCVFGQGLLDAYDAETKLARDPRIVLADSAMDLVHHHLAYYGKIGEAPHNTALLVDADGQLFVNYLYLAVDGVEGLPAEFVSAIESHRDLIVARLGQFADVPAVWSKYAWSGNYHNHFCKNYTGLEDRRIPATLLATAPRFLSQVYKCEGDRVLRNGVEVAKTKYLGSGRPSPNPNSAAHARGMSKMSEKPIELFSSRADRYPEPTESDLALGPRERRWLPYRF